MLRRSSPSFATYSAHLTFGDSWAIPNVSQTTYTPSNEGYADINWTTGLEPISAHGRVSFPLGHPIHRERPYISASRSSQGSTVWHIAESPYGIDSPALMEDEMMEPGCIYLRRNLTVSEQQVWVHHDERDWVVADMYKDYKRK